MAISAGDYHTVGLRRDGTVVSCGRNDYGQCNITGWTDVVAVDAGYAHTVGLRSDGSAMAVGRSEYGMCNVTGW